MGLIQSVLAPEAAKIFCESLDDAVRSTLNKQQPVINQKATELKLKDGTAFYRNSRLSLKGLGFEFLCGNLGRTALVAQCYWQLQQLYQAKEAGFRNIMPQLQLEQDQHPAEQDDRPKSGSGLTC